MREAERARGLLLGLAIGDALGAPVEFLRLEQIQERYGPRGVQGYVRAGGMFTDDTQMSMAVAEAVIEAGALPVGGLMEAVTRRFVEWLDSPDNFRAPGISTRLACRRLKEGAPWTLAGDPKSKGCGSVMRTAPVGFFYRRDPARLREAAHAIGIATHREPSADAACIAAARAASLAALGKPPSEWLADMRGFTAGLSGELDATLARVEAALPMPDEEEAVALIGERFDGWTADEVLGIALYAVLRHPGDFSAAVLRAVNNSGDSDSIACVAGGLSGALLGRSAIPEAWVEGIERREDLEALAESLAAA